jgi:CheY-like chemotaxis protein
MALDRCPAPLEIQRLTNGEDALNLVRCWQISQDRQKPALVILDFNLPRVNGLEILSAIKSHYATQDLPVILFSSSLSPSAKQKAKALGADDCVTKSIDLYQMVDSLIAACSRFLHKQQPRKSKTEHRRFHFEPPVRSGFEA